MKLEKMAFMTQFAAILAEKSIITWSSRKTPLFRQKCENGRK
jgi:hypothetical protein